MAAGSGLAVSVVTGLVGGGLPVSAIVTLAGVPVGDSGVAGGLAKAPGRGGVAGVPAAGIWPAGVEVLVWGDAGLLPGQLRTSWINRTRLAL